MKQPVLSITEETWHKRNSVHPQVNLWFQMITSNALGMSTYILQMHWSPAIYLRCGWSLGTNSATLLSAQCQLAEGASKSYLTVYSKSWSCFLREKRKSYFTPCSILQEPARLKRRGPRLLAPSKRSQRVPPPWADGPAHRSPPV